mmetsp:Transcript_9361/g.26334  ORF Transcript_9361/g.26334 Transcript_9361/m.26334 type:complete len:408 (-) Transcript_9361:1405-2628(-)
MQERLHGLLAQPDGGELVADVHQQRAALREVGDEPLEVVVVLEEVVRVHKRGVVLSLHVVRRRVCPLATVREVVADGAPCLLQELLVATVLSQLQDALPVPDPHTEVDGEVLPVDLAVQVLRLIEALEIGGNLGLLLHAVFQQPQPLHELDALVVLEAHKGLLGDVEVELIQSRLCEQPPQPAVGVGLNVVVGVLQVGHLGQDVPRVAQALGLEVKQDLLAGALVVLDYLVHEHALDLQVLESGYVRVREHGLLRLQAAHDVHAGLLHDGEEVRVVASPTHIPDVLPLELELMARFLAARLHLDVVEREHPVDVDHEHPGAVAVRRDDLRSAPDGESALEPEMRQRIPLHRTTLAGHQEACVRGGQAGDWVLHRRGGRCEAFFVVHARAGSKTIINVEHHLNPPLVR